MTLENVVSTEGIKERLKNLRELMPGNQDFIYQFGEFLADRLNPEMTPGGFRIAAGTAIYDLRNGFDTARKPIKSQLVGYPPQIYAILLLEIPRIAEAVCPPVFAQEVKKLYETGEREKVSVS